MSKGIILFQSKYGATERYAKWLQEELGYDCIQTKDAKLNLVLEYDNIILGGGVYASGIAGLSFLKKNIANLKGKKVAVFCAGASPYDEKAIKQVRELHFKAELCEVPLFYCRGAWNEEAMTFTDRTLCRMLQKSVAKKDPATYEPWEEALMTAAKGPQDWTDKRNLEQLINYMRTQ